MSAEVRDTEVPVAPAESQPEPLPIQDALPFDSTTATTNSTTATTETVTITVPVRDETERLDPQPLKMELRSGLKFEVEALRLRQFLALTRIITRGASGVLSMGGLNGITDSEDFVRQLIGMTLFAIPEAEDETIAFLQSMIRPQYTGDPKRDEVLRQDLRAELENPDLMDTVEIIQAVLEHEGDDLRALGKRLRAMFQVVQKMGLVGNQSQTT